jgi:hypothetical protein
MAVLAANCMQEGSWDDVCGETFLRTLLGMPVQEAKYSVVCRTMYIHMYVVKGVRLEVICRASPIY